MVAQPVYQTGANTGLTTRSIMLTVAPERMCCYVKTCLTMSVANMTEKITSVANTALEVIDEAVLVAYLRLLEGMK